MAEEKVNLFVMGKTGHGKSATANMLIDGKHFKASSSTSSTTKDAVWRYALWKDFLLTVIDGPGLADTDVDSVEDKEAIIKSMSTALSLCHEGIDAFLFVIRFPIRFTKEEVSVLDALKGLFGDGYLDRMIVVVTFGALFYDEMKEYGLSPDFFTWCRKQGGAFSELYKSCSGRFVLVENREKDIEKKQAQRMEIVKHAVLLKKVKGRYSCQYFEQAKFEREKLIVELKAPIFTTKIQEKVFLLSAEIKQLSEKSAELGRERIKDRVRELLGEIDETDQGYGLLKELRGLVVRVEQNLDDKLELIHIGQALEKLREEKESWFRLRVSTMFYPIVGYVIGLTALASEAVISFKENKLKDKQKALQKKKSE